jgi:hypothetical protein
MFKKLLAFVAAATTAAILVALVPAPGPAAGSVLPEIGKERMLTVSAANTSPPLSVSTDRARVCRQGWPYYEQSCLHDARQHDGKARSVRVIALSRTAGTPSNAIHR